MPRFPRNEPELAALALVVTQGLRDQRILNTVAEDPL